MWWSLVIGVQTSPIYRLEVEVVKVNGTYYSNDNRRLKVLREYQHDLGRELYVPCRVFE